MKTAVIVIYLVLSVILAIVVMMQEGKGGGLVSTPANTESYWGKNRGRSKEAILRKVTAVLGFLYMALALFLSSKFI